MNLLSPLKLDTWYIQIYIYIILIYTFSLVRMRENIFGTKSLIWNIQRVHLGGQKHLSRDHSLQMVYWRQCFSAHATYPNHLGEILLSLVEIGPSVDISVFFLR